MATTSLTSESDALQRQTVSPLADIMRRARRVSMQRAALASIAVGILLGGMVMFDLTSWPPHLDKNPAASVPFAVAFGGCIALVAFCLSWFQLSRYPDRYLSPLPGLGAEARRCVKADIRDGRVSDDDMLRPVEFRHAEQVTASAPTSMGSVIAIPVIYACATIVFFVAGSPVTGCAWLVLSVFTSWNMWRRYQRGLEARSFLMHTTADV